LPLCLIASDRMFSSILDSLKYTNAHQTSIFVASAKLPRSNSGRPFLAWTATFLVMTSPWPNERGAASPGVIVPGSYQAIPPLSLFNVIHRDPRSWISRRKRAKTCKSVLGANERGRPGGRGGVGLRAKCDRFLGGPLGRIYLGRVAAL
jgi:hypothetical protein